MATDSEEQEGGEQETLIEFGGRRDNATGASEKFRIVVGEWRGRLNTHLRMYYWAQHPRPGDDGWRASKKGVCVRESELDETIAVLEEVRRRVRGEGRATSRAEPGTRNPRARTVAKQRAREAQQRQHEPQTASTPAAKQPYQLEPEDDLAAYRNRRQ